MPVTYTALGLGYHQWFRVRLRGSAGPSNGWLVGTVARRRSEQVQEQGQRDVSKAIAQEQGRKGAR